MKEPTKEGKERKVGEATKIEHERARMIIRRTEKKPPPDVVRENRLVDWAEALRENAMLIAAAGVLAAEGDLRKAASVLEWAGFGVPAGYFSEGDEGYDYFPNDEEALRLWVEGEAGRIEGALAIEGFRLAATGGLMDEANPMGTLGDLAARMRERGCGPDTTVGEFLEGGGG